MGKIVCLIDDYVVVDLLTMRDLVRCEWLVQCPSQRALVHRGD